MAKVLLLGPADEQLAGVRGALEGTEHTVVAAGDEAELVLVAAADVGGFKVAAGVSADATVPRVLLLDRAPDDALVADALAAGAADVWRADIPPALLATRVRQLARAAPESEDFVHDAAHDMKSPLLAIRRYAALLLEDDEVRLPGDLRRFLERIEVNAVRLGHLVEQMVALARATRRPLAREPVRPGAVVQEALRRARGRLGELAVSVADDLPLVAVDFDRLVDAVAALLDNAATYAGHDARLEVHAEPAGAGEVHLVFRDYGPGVPADERERVFEVFRRLHRRDEIEGAGLGLPIVRRVVARHGGRVWIESPADGGTAVHLVLPAP